MSWQAFRYGKETIQQRREARREKAILRRLRKMEPLSSPSEEELVCIFGSTAPEYARRVCERMQRMKGRIPGIGPEEASFRRKKFKNRNYHHLTPRCRKGEPYRGSERRNMLLIRLDRHNAWHRAFGVMTLEEIISGLAHWQYMPYSVRAAIRRKNRRFCRIALRRAT